ncbi:PEP-CTERM sorting domain-containing protein [Candidatus Symbiobacter mobilis]|uniref:Ice-binding protein C-terminal domain-containing protein n=1 Tax=Candidatus Symbiobacter mobilis CR TaxID=946483 RepID=U5NBC7_9BURK|nr:PEP-CTERM sorting domain-containing protein [Candidatus Symbiobacter mobilis]AGX88625.1 hypothetical protein Cenrod_2572 [Candidatus Symbiobacter mobilis CR]
MQNVLTSTFRTMLGGALAMTLLASAAYAVKPADTDTNVLNPLSSVYCSDSDVTTGNGGFTGCLGAFAGNIDNQFDAIRAAASAGLGLQLGAYYSSEAFADAGNPFLENVGAVDTGLIQFDAPQTGLFVLGLKQGNSFSLYAFDGSAVSGGIASLRYDNTGVVDHKGSHSDLSHAGYFAATSVTPVPEPESLAMLLAGLGVLGVAVRRRAARA